MNVFTSDHYFAMQNTIMQAQKCLLSTPVTFADISARRNAIVMRETEIGLNSVGLQHVATDT